MKRSAGIVVFKKVNNELYIFLAHMGGPYWRGIPMWSILKGEKKKGENCKETAIREFEEECGKKLDYKDFFYLHTEKQKSKKLVIFFAAQVDNIVIDGCHSNTFQKEYPKGSGNMQEFPEMDEYRWVPIEEAKSIILKGQKKSLVKLEKILQAKKGQ